MSRGSASAGQSPSAPAPDRLEGFAHPSEVVDLFGHQPAEQLLLDRLKSGRMPHAWLMSGPEGIGKATLAYRLARFVLQDGDPVLAAATASDLHIDEDSATFRKVAGFSHSNLTILRRPWQEKTKRFATAITINEVRRLRSFLGTTAASGPWRVVIVDRAEDMNVNASNALLKSLEEPPDKTLFLLVCSAPGQVPVTIRSRCRALRLSGLDNELLQSAVGAALARAAGDTPDPAEINRALPLAEGSVRRVLELIELGGGTLYDRLITVLSKLPSLDQSSLHKLSDELTGRDSEARFELAFALLGDALARIVRQAATGAGAIGKEAALSARLAEHADLAQWAELWETVHRVKADAVALNLDRKNLILDVFFRLSETARHERP